MQKISKQGGRKIMGIEQTMDLKLVKKKDLRQKKDGGSRTIDLDLLTK